MSAQASSHTPVLPPAVREEIARLRQGGLTIDDVVTEIRIGFQLRVSPATVSVIGMQAGVRGKTAERERIRRTGLSRPFSAEEDALILAGRGAETSRTTAQVLTRARRLVALGAQAAPGVLDGSRMSFVPSGLMRDDRGIELMMRQAALTFWRAADALERERGVAATTDELARACGISFVAAAAQLRRLRALGAVGGAPGRRGHVGRAPVLVAPPAIGGVA